MTGIAEYAQITSAAQAGQESQESLSRKSKVRVCLEIQRVLKDRLDDKKAKNLEVASLARSWDLIEERLRILRGKPLPGQLQPGQDKPKRRAGLRRSIAITPETVAEQMKIA